MPDVKVLIAGNNNLNLAKKGDVIEVVPSVSDWGSKTVAPNWVRLTVLNVPGATQQESEDLIRGFLRGWEKGFSYSEVSGATGGLQRYRVQVIPELANDFTLAGKLHIRDTILARFGLTTDDVVNQISTGFEFDASPGLPLDEIEQVIRELEFRRYYFPATMIDNAMSGVPDGTAVEESATFTFVSNNIVDRMKE